MRYRTTRLSLPSPASAVLAGDVVWVACGDGTLRSFGLDGTDRTVVSAAASALAGTDDALLALDAHGRLTTHDPATGQAVDDGRTVAARKLCSDGREAWAVDDRAGRAESVWPPSSASTIDLGADVSRVAIGEGRLWWTTTTGHLRASDGHDLPMDDVEDLGACPLAVCAGSVWVGQAQRLARVGARRSDRGIDVATGTGRPTVLACAGGRLVGASPSAILVLDPRVDEDVTVLEADVGGVPVAALGDHARAWVVGGGGALLVTR